MKSKGVDTKDERIWLGQLYGMSDNISYNLADHNYNIAKIFTFGPVSKDV
jgi:proline dehydrogenase